MSLTSRTVTEADIAALLALTATFANWQAAPDSPAKDTLAADVDRQLDALDARPDSWHGLKELVGTVGDDVISGLVRYSLARSEGQTRDLIKTFANEPERKRGRRRDRER